MPYHVVVRAYIIVPDEVYEAFGHTPEYERFSLSVSHAAATAGRDTYANVEENAEFSIVAEAQKWERAWKEQIAEWERRLASQEPQDGPGAD